MFSMSEMLVIGVLALILIGPKQLPEVARTVGRLLAELKRTAYGFTEEIQKQAGVDELKSMKFKATERPQLAITDEVIEPSTPQNEDGQLVMDVDPKDKHGHKS